ncbi:zinc finger MYM-type 1-like, partial [Paramuricea clavata]
MNQLETGILAALWHHILHRFHTNSQALQSADQDLNSAVAIYESLMDFIGKQRPRFEKFEAEGKKLGQCDQYVGEEKRVCKRNRHYDEPGSAPEVSQTPANKFRMDTFLVIIDKIDAELRKRLHGAYTGIAARFGFLQKLKDLSVEEVVESAMIFQEAYPTDLEASLSDELVQFSVFFRTDFAMKSLDHVTTASATSSPAMNDTSSDESDDEDDLMKDDNNVTLNVDSLELRMYRLLLENNLETVFPNTAIALRIYLSLMISNCSGERSFSKLKLIKNQLRSCMTQKRLNSLIVLSIESDLLRSIDMSSIINEFAR